MRMCFALFAFFTACIAVCLDPPSSADDNSTGMAGDIGQAWDGIAEYPIKIKDGDTFIPAKIKIRSDPDNYYFLVKFPADSEKLQHRPWHWDPPNQMYVSGDEREEALCLIFTDPKNAGSDKSDVWIWRSARTNPTGFAEDHHCFTESIGQTGNGSAGKVIRLDAGTPPWESRFFAKFAGETIPRFHNRTPTGSAADVKAKGRWQDGSWTIEFSRKADTGNPDDIPIANTELMIIKGAPDFKSLDITGMDKFQIPPKAGNANEPN